MRNYREISTKLRRKNLLTNLILLIDKSRLRNLVNLANKLDFQFMQIIALRNQSKIAFITNKDVSKKSRLVTNNFVLIIISRIVALSLYIICIKLETSNQIILLIFSK